MSTSSGLPGLTPGSGRLVLVINRQVEDHGDPVSADDEVTNAGSEVSRVFNAKGLQSLGNHFFRVCEWLAERLVGICFHLLQVSCNYDLSPRSKG